MSTMTSAPSESRARMTGQRLGALVALLIALVSSLAVLAPALSAHAEDDANKYSFYGAASTVAGSYARSISPEGGNEHWSVLTDSPGEAGALLGFVDSSIFDKAIGWLFQSTTQGSMAISMESLKAQSEGSSGNGPLQYAQYGAVLNSMGLDSTATGFSDLSRLGSGGIMWGAYMAALIPDALLLLPVMLLQWLNPFKFFYTAFAGVSPGLAEALVGGDVTGITGPLRPLVTVMSGLYSVTSDLGWSLAIPLLAGVALFSWLVFGKGSIGSVFKGIVVRVLFLAVGLPLLGLVYTQALNAIVASGDTGAATAQVVASRYVDFEAWVTNKRLGLPSGATVEWNTKDQAPSSQSWTDLNDTTLAINEWATGQNYGFSPTSEADWTQISAGGQDTSKAWVAAGDLLTRYLSGTKVQASGYASTVQTSMNQDNLKDWFTRIHDGSEDLSANDISTNGLLDDASLQAGVDSGVVKFGSNGAAGMSRLATYNYLASTFDAGGVSFYSLALSSSFLSTPQHNAVNAVGDTVVAVLNWVSGFVLLGSYMAIGVGYGLGVFSMILKRTFKLFTSIPMAALGSIRAISVVVSSVLVMIGGLFATIFLYLMVKQLLMIIPLIVQSLFKATGGLAASGLNLVSGPGGVVAGVVGLVVTLLVSVLLVLSFTISALRVRKGIMRSLEQIVDGVVDKIMPESTPKLAGVDPAKAAAGPGVMSKGVALAGGAAALGAGGGIAKKLLVAGIETEGAEGAAGAAGAAGKAVESAAAGESKPAKESAESAGKTSKDEGGAGKKPVGTVVASTAVGALQGAVVGGGLPGAAAGAAKGAAGGVAKAAAQKRGSQAGSGEGTEAGSTAEAEPKGVATAQPGALSAGDKRKQVLGHGLSGATQSAQRALMHGGGMRGALQAAVAGGVSGLSKGARLVKETPTAPTPSKSSKRLAAAPPPTSAASSAARKVVTRPAPSVKSSARPVVPAGRPQGK